jgi:hypothetical protein
MIAKELREAAGIVAIAAAFYVHYLSRAMRHDILPWHYGYVDYNAIPFINLNSLGSLAWVSAALALALGFRQTVGESIYGTWLFLRHRPVGWRWLLGVKLFVGLTVYLFCAAAAVLAYAWWAATPGTHASPFEWSMTAPAWKDWISMPLLYFGAFLSGLRPARWFGTRLLPLVFAGAFAFWLPDLRWWPVGGLCVIGLLSAAFVAVIFFVARTRDF